MDSLQSQLTLLNQASRKILSELGKEEPSMEVVEHAFEQRGRNIKQLGILSELYDSESLSPKDQAELTALFNEFKSLNKQILTALNKRLQRHQEKLFDATKRRKAEDGYQILKKPDISYF